MAIHNLPRHIMMYVRHIYEFASDASLLCNDGSNFIKLCHSIRLAPFNVTVTCCSTSLTPTRGSQICRSGADRRHFITCCSLPVFVPWRSAASIGSFCCLLRMQLIFSVQSLLFSTLISSSSHLIYFWFIIIIAFFSKAS